MSNLISPGVMHRICQVPVKGKILKYCEANRNMLAGWIHEDQGEVASVAWFQKVLGENPRYEAQLIWESADLLDPSKRRQAAEQATEETRKVFSAGARHFKEFGDSTANFQFACSILGNSFDAYQLEQAWLAGALQGLSSVTAQELEEWKQEETANENELLKADAVTPSQVQQQKEIRMRRFQESKRSSAQERLEHELVTGFQRDITFGDKKYPLPLDWHGQTLNAGFIKRCDAKVLKTLISVFGSSQVTARLHGMTRASAIIDHGDGRGPVLVECEFV